MSRKGNCWDNAVAESFFHSLKTELTYHCQFQTREEAKSATVSILGQTPNTKQSPITGSGYLQRYSLKSDYAVNFYFL